MAHYAKIDENSKVMSVIVVANTDCQNADGIEEEEVGRQFLENTFGGSLWKKCSYNTRGNVHLTGGTPLRKNFAGVGYTYDEAKDAFIAPQLFVSWTLNETSCLWESPIAYPTDGKD
jgi:hypothetical protein